MSTHQHLRAAVLALAAVSCQDDGGLLVPGRGLVPRADARVADHEEKLVMLPLTGDAVTLALDGSRSRDLDGKIVKYRWLSGTAASPAEAGSGAHAAGREVPSGAEPDWPEDIAKPEVTLAAGSYSFTLWVVDDRGLVSAPDSVKVIVASP